MRIKGLTEEMYLLRKHLPKHHSFSALCWKDHEHTDNNHLDNNYLDIPFYKDFPELLKWNIFQADNYMLKVKNRNFRAMCEMCSKLTIKTPEWRHHVVLMALLLNLNTFDRCLWKSQKLQSLVSTGIITRRVNLCRH